MEANELMIGNWVHPPYPLQVVNICKDCIYCDFEGNEGDVWEFSPKDLQGIPLIPEILNRIPTKSLYTENVYYLGEGFYIHDDSGVYEQVKYTLSIGFIGIGIKIKCLHELQNRFFTQTGKELEVKM